MDLAGLSSRLDRRLARGRSMAQARMTSRATIRRKANATTTDPTTGLLVDVWADVYTDHPCRIDSGGSSDGGSTGVTVGGITFEDATGVGHFPHPSADLADNDVVQVTAGEWPEAFYRIVAATKYDQKTARRLPIVEVSRPEGWGV